MPSHISVIPASTQGGAAAIRALLASAQNPHVRASYRDTSKAPAEFKANPRFTAVQADVGSGTGIDFDGSDAVFYIPPPAMDGTDGEVFAKKSSDAIKNAIKTSSTVKRLLVLSAIAAQNDHGIGLLRLNHLTDKFEVPSHHLMFPRNTAQVPLHGLAIRGAQCFHLWLAPGPEMAGPFAERDYAEADHVWRRRRQCADGKCPLMATPSEVFEVFLEEARVNVESGS